MRVYELGFILKPDLPAADVQASIDAIQGTLTRGGATIDKVDEWGKRKLAYRVQGFWNGHYVFIQYSVKDATSVNIEMERRLRVSDNVIKYMNIRIDEDLKRLKKAAKRRAKRAPRLAAKAAAAAQAQPPRHQTPGKPQPGPAAAA